MKIKGLAAVLVGIVTVGATAGTVVNTEDNHRSLTHFGSENATKSNSAPVDDDQDLDPSFGDLTDQIEDMYGPDMVGYFFDRFSADDDPSLGPPSELEDVAASNSTLARRDFLPGTHPALPPFKDVIKAAKARGGLVALEELVTRASVGKSRLQEVQANEDEHNAIQEALSELEVPTQTLEKRATPTNALGVLTTLPGGHGHPDRGRGHPGRGRIHPSPTDALGVLTTLYPHPSGHGHPGGGRGHSGGHGHPGRGRGHPGRGRGPPGKGRDHPGKGKGKLTPAQKYATYLIQQTIANEVKSRVIAKKVQKDTAAMCRRNECQWYMEHHCWIQAVNMNMNGRRLGYKDCRSPKWCRANNGFCNQGTTNQVLHGECCWLTESGEVDAHREHPDVVPQVPHVDTMYG